MTTPHGEPRSTSAVPALPLMPCARCTGAGVPFMVETIPRSNLLRLAVRCPGCRHEWETQLAAETLQAS